MTEVTVIKIPAITTLRPGTSFLDCNGTNNVIGNLRWSRQGSALPFTVNSRSTVLRIDITSGNTSDIYGEFTCSDIVTNEELTITITAGKLYLHSSMKKKTF